MCKSKSSYDCQIALFSNSVWHSFYWHCGTDCVFNALLFHTVLQDVLIMCNTSTKWHMADFRVAPLPLVSSLDNFFYKAFRVDVLLLFNTVLNAILCFLLQLSPVWLFAWLPLWRPSLASPPLLLPPMDLYEEVYITLFSIWSRGCTSVKKIKCVTKAENTMNSHGLSSPLSNI